MADKLDGKRVVLAVPPTQFREEEVFEPKRVLEKAGAAVVIASTSIRTCRGMQDGSIEAEHAIADLDPAAYDALVLTGGSATPEFFWKDKALLELVGQMAEAGKVIAAISLSTVVLAKAKLLEGRRATVYYLPEAIDALTENGATYVEDKLVIEENLITAEGPAQAGAFGEAIAQALAG